MVGAVRTGPQDIAGFRLHWYYQWCGLTGDIQSCCSRQQRDAPGSLAIGSWVFNSANASKDGHLTIDEFVKMCDDPVLQLWLSAIGLSTTDAAKVFYLIDDGDGKISAEELVEGVDRFRGVASGIDLHLLVYDMDDRVHRMFAEQAMQLVHFSHKLNFLQGRVDAQAEMANFTATDGTIEV
mmetsp:Transcript_20063/g.46136  ORF Transcript_20063/g.46136 Transcript_20063/m.46136 type:complete len:181 (+) Transcript_20063:386-928(+)